MDTTHICPSCGKPLAPNAPKGICPECLLKAGFPTGSQAQPGGGAQPKPNGFIPPKSEELAPHFPQLEILELLGQGGMGAVYKAKQKGLDRLVALKVLPPETAGSTAFSERFTREARAMALLNHPNIVAVYDFGQSGGFYYFLMEFVDGVNLRQMLEAHRLSPREAMAIVPQICDALQYAHDQGIVHRDIKPENVLVDKQGRVKIADFGLAKLLGKDPQGERLTRSAEVMGTPQYMAPEQLEKPLEVDHRADIYSLGVVFYEMLTGELPLGRFAPPSHKVQIDVRLDEVVLRALSKEPERRYQQASVLKSEVETIVTTAPSNTESFAQEILSRDYVLDIGSCLRRGWALVRNDFGPVVGITAAVLLLAQASNSVLLGLATGPLLGGLSLYYIKKIRGERPTVETAFSGFTTAFLNLLVAGLLTGIPWILGFLCLVLPRTFCLLLPGIVYLVVAWQFALALVIDKGLDFWPAMELSRHVVSKHWWKFFGFLLILWLPFVAGGMVLVNVGFVLGALVLLVGLFTTTPIACAAATFAYEDIFGTTRKPPAVPPAASRIEPAAGRKVSPLIAIVRWTARILGTLMFLLLTVFVIAQGTPAIPNQPVSVQIEFVGFFLMALGFLVGWKWDGWAALSILAGVAIFHMVEAKVLLSGALEAPSIVGGLYGLCWWMQRRPPSGTWPQALKNTGIRLLLLVVVHLALFEWLAQVSVHWKESTGELWDFRLAAASLVGMVWVFWPRYRLRGSIIGAIAGTIVGAILLLALDNFYSWQVRPALGLYQEADWVAQHPGFQKELRRRIGLGNPAQPNVEVTGTVIDAVTGKPIAGARVSDNIYGADADKAPRESWTDASGYYMLGTWYEEHSLAASAAGYETKLAILLTKPFGKEHEVHMDFQLQPAGPVPSGMSEPADLASARVALAAFKTQFGANHPDVLKAQARVEELERMTREEPNAPAELREAKAQLAELRSSYGEDHPQVQEALAKVKALEAKSP